MELTQWDPEPRSDEYLWANGLIDDAEYDKRKEIELAFVEMEVASDLDRRERELAKLPNSDHRRLVDGEITVDGYTEALIRRVDDDRRLGMNKYIPEAQKTPKKPQTLGRKLLNL